MQLKPGSRLKSATCETEIIIVRSGPDDVELLCGGAPMLAFDAPDAREPLRPGEDGGTVLGKRYVHGDIEALCTKAGQGSLTIDGQPFSLKDAKSLPSSD